MHNESIQADQLFLTAYLDKLEEESEINDFIWSYLENDDKYSRAYSADLIQRYYLNNSLIANNLQDTLKSIMKIHTLDPMSTLILAMTSLEVLTKNIILRPFLNGMLHNSELADMLAKQVLTQNGLDRFNNLVFWIFDQFLEFDDCSAKDISFQNTKQTIWQARANLQKIRNAAIHQAKVCTIEDAEQAINLFIVFDIYTSQLLEVLGLKYKTNKNNELEIGLKSDDNPNKALFEKVVEIKK
ncbi:hypothetical protein K0W35_001688 [Vibrio parahaemolyticus]|nr:hypothetical protein [Vibrio parahaemolyticus]